MTQLIGRPDADVTSSGTWVFNPDPPSTFFDHLNDDSGTDSTYVQSPAAGGSFTVRLSRLVKPTADQLANESMTLTVRVKAGAANTKLGISLYQESTLVRSWVKTVGISWQAVEIALSAAEKAAITKYSDLRVSVFNTINGHDIIEVPGCDRPYPDTITATWSNGTGTCGCFTGSFPLTWNGTAFVGVFTGCTAAVNVTATFSTSSLLWGVGLSSTSYTFGPIVTADSGCGDLPIVTDIGVTGACSGHTALTFSL